MVGILAAVLALRATRAPEVAAGCPTPDLACLEGAGELEGGACEVGEDWTPAGCAEDRGDEPFTYLVVR